MLFFGCWTVVRQLHSLLWGGGPCWFVWGVQPFWIKPFMLAMSRVCVLEFVRSPQWFLDCIICGHALDRHRFAMLAVGRPCIFADGVKLIAKPEDVNDVLFHISSAGVTFEEGEWLSWDDLRPRHFIVSESLEVEVMAALAEFPGSGIDGGKGKDKVRVKRRVVIDVPRGPWHRPPVTEGCASDGSESSSVSDVGDCSLSFSF
jgi:hypothetical protein